MTAKTKTIDIQTAWKRAKAALKHDMPDWQWRQQIDPLEAISMVDNKINIQAADGLDVDWLNARVKKTAERQLAGILAEDVLINFTSKIPEAGLTTSKDRKAQLTQAYGETRASIIQPHKTIYQTHYFWRYWRPLLGRTTSDVVLACRSLCYWNIKTGEIRNQVTTDRVEISDLACCSETSVDRALRNNEVSMYFVRKKIARVMTPEGPRNHGLILKVRMDDPLIPQHQEKYNMPEPSDWLDPVYYD